MSKSSRRGFVKSMIASAAGVTPACSCFRSQILAAVLTGPDAPAFLTLQNGDQQLRFSSPGTILTFQSFLHAEDEWKPATLPDTPLVVGASFPLETSRIHRENDSVIAEGKATAHSLEGSPFAYDWNAEVRALSQPQAPWFRFRLNLRLPAPLRLQQGSRIEPQIIFWLNSTSTLMEGQLGSWRRVTLSQPTRNSLGTSGNDLPAVYLLDQTSGVESMMYFDMSDMAWMSAENLPRFLVYRCSTRSEIRGDGTQRLGIGLLADQAVGNLLPAGEVRFSYFFLQRPMERLLTEQEAVNRWMTALLPLFEEKLSWPRCATSWKQFATSTVEDLQKHESTRVEVNGHAGLRAYVKDS